MDQCYDGPTGPSSALRHKVMVHDNGATPGGPPLPYCTVTTRLPLALTVRYPGAVAETVVVPAATGRNATPPCAGPPVGV